ncbi:MAG: ABC transporter substrate-binding protein [Alphaproteobacteria bacterium]|jgi:putative ABC transport system substrate-binding protein|nr:ABC transporter substrate-binding protein [Alphaproteobacteria bacterium]
MRRRHVLALTAGGAGTLAAGRLWARRDEPFRIYRITYRGRTAVEEGFDDYLAANGVPVVMTERDIGRDTTLLPGLIDEIREVRPDLVVTWGTPVTLGVAGRHDEAHDDRHITDIPIVFALVSAPLRSAIVPSLERPQRNVTGAVHVVPTETQLRAMASYRPFSHLGVLYTPTEPNSVTIVEELAELQPRLGYTLVQRRIPLGPDGMPTADGIEELVAEIRAEGAEWLYLLPDTFLGTVYDRVVPAALAVDLPTFGAVELAVRRGGALVALVSRYYSVGQLAASKALQILAQGRNPGDIPIETLSRFSLIINMALARELELYPPIDMLNYAEVVTG